MSLKVAGIAKGAFTNYVMVLGGGGYHYKSLHLGGSARPAPKKMEKRGERERKERGRRGERK